MTTPVAPNAPAAPATPAAPAPAPFNPPRGTIDYAKVLGDAAAKTAPAPKAPVAPAPVETPKPPAEAKPVEGENPTEEKLPEGASDNMKKTFERMAKQSAELRTREEKVRTLEIISSRFDQNSLNALIKAAQADDPVSALASMGWTPADFQAAMQGKAPKKVEPEAPPVDERYSRLEKELETLKGTLQQRQMAEGRSRVLGTLEQLAKAPEHKFEFLDGDERATSEALSIVEDFVTKNGPPPANEVNDLFLAALRVVDGNRKAEAEVWEKRLTAKGRVGKVAPQEPPVQPAPVQSEPRIVSHNTITNTMNSPAPAGRPPPKKGPADYLNDAIAAAREFDKGR